MAQVSKLPRDNLFRAQALGYELRDGDDGSPVLTGHFAVFNQWTEIHSIFEGHFMERLVPGAFKKTFAENREQMRVLFQHGRDPQMGNKILGPIDVLEEDDRGAHYEVPLLDGIPSLLLSGLRKKLYGASFRFRVIREEINEKPGKSAHNPEGLPERTVKEVEVSEFGPVTFPAYANATAGVRSLTDEFVMERFVHDPHHLAEVIEFVRDEMHERGAIPSHDTPTTEENPGGSAVLTKCKSAADYRSVCAWVDSSGDPAQRASYKLPHHVSPGGAASLPLVRNALARLPQSNIPQGDHDAVKRHLQRHLDAAKRDAPPPSDAGNGHLRKGRRVSVDAFLERRTANAH
jgi:HK97 family phage prohead protease